MKKSSSYKPLLTAISDQKNLERSLANRLTFFKKHQKDINKIALNMLLEEGEKLDKDTTKGELQIKIVSFLLTFDRINTWLSKDKKNTLLNSLDLQKLDDKDKKKAGISLHRLFLIAYGIANEVIKEKSQEIGFSYLTLSNSDWAKYAKTYHLVKAQAREAREVKKAKKVEISEVTESLDLSKLTEAEILTEIEKDKAIVNDLDVLQIESLRELATGTTKARLTRALKKLA